MFGTMISRIVTSRRIQQNLSASVRTSSKRCCVLSSSSWGADYDSFKTSDRPVWTQEWKDLGLGCTLVDKDERSNFISNLFFVQVGFGVDQHGETNNATKAATRAVRNAIEFNSIPGVIEAIPGGRKEMLIQVKLGIPAKAITASSTTTDSDMDLLDDAASSSSTAATMPQPMMVDPLQIAKVFPYGRLLPIEMVVGGLSFSTGRLVPELGDIDDSAICVAACVSIGYNNQSHPTSGGHVVYSSKEGF
jgi:Conserved hypothetical protein (Lin0512_fam)